MLDEERMSDDRYHWSSWWAGFDWEETRAGVDRESRGRILLLGLAHAGKSTLFNRLRGWPVSPPAPANRSGETDGRSARLEDFGLFCLLDLPEETSGGDGMGQDFSANGLDPLDLADEADLLVYVLDGTAGVRAADFRWIGRLRRLGTPLVVTLNKSDLMGEEALERLPEIEERLATSVLPISALNGTNVTDGLLPRMVDACPALAVPLGRELRGFRRQAAARLIRRAAVFNGLIALEPVPLLDIPLQMITLVGLVLRVAAVYGRPPTDAHRREVMAAMAGGLAGRYATQQVVKLVPILGWLVSGLIGASCTWLLGRAAVAYFEAGGDTALAERWERARSGLRQRCRPLRVARQPLRVARQPLRVARQPLRVIWRRWVMPPWTRVRRRWRHLPRPQVRWVRPEAVEEEDEG